VIVGDDGQVIKISEGFYPDTLPADQSLIIYDDGTFEVYDKKGDIRITGNWESFAQVYDTTTNSWEPFDGSVYDFGFGSNTTSSVSVNLFQLGYSIDLFVANNPQSAPGSEIDAMGGEWIDASGNFNSFDGSLTDDISFIRVFGEATTGQNYDPRFDTDSAADWSTSSDLTLGDFNTTQLTSLSLPDEAGQTILYGDDSGITLDGVGGPDFMHGGAGDDILDGGTDNDYLDGMSGDDELYGGAGDDTLVFDSNDSVIDGGVGEDTLIVGSSSTFDLTNVQNIETIKLDGATLTDEITVADVFGATTSGNHELSIEGSGQLNIVTTGEGGDWIQSPSDSGVFSAVYGTDTVILTIDDTNITII